MKVKATPRKASPSQPPKRTTTKYLQIGALEEYTGLSVMSLKRVVASDPTFPQGIKLSTRLRVYALEDVMAWIESRRSAPPPTVSLHAAYDVARPVKNPRRKVQP
jgi:predicted DNA-binding transcriptional regulator AlpA